MIPTAWARPGVRPNLRCIGWPSLCSGPTDRRRHCAGHNFLNQKPWHPAKPLPAPAACTLASRPQRRCMLTQARGKAYTVVHLQANFRNQARVFDAQQKAIHEAKSKAEAKVWPVRCQALHHMM